MVLIDGHDSAWSSKFKTAAAAICNDCEDLTCAVEKNDNNFRYCRKNKYNSKSAVRTSPEEQRKRKIVFMHLNLTHVPWEQFHLYDTQQERNYYDQIVIGRGNTNTITNDDDDRNHVPFLGIEVVDCTGLDVALSYIFKLPIQQLYITTNDVLTKEIGDVLAIGLKQSSWILQKFQLSSATWTPSSMKGLVRGLQAATTLQELNLSYTKFRQQHVNEPPRGETNVNLDQLQQRHDHHHPQDRGHGLENHGGDAELDDGLVHANECVRILAKGLSTTQIFCLKMNRCYLNDDQIKTLIREGLLKRDHLLQELYLGGNSLGRRGLTALADYLSVPDGCSLVTLELSNTLRNQEQNEQQPTDDHESTMTVDETRTNQNIITGTTVHELEVLYPAISANTSLRVLHLASNGLQDDDMLPLCSAVSMSQVTMLDLKSNRITSHGTQILAQNLPPQLERLWLLGNPTAVDGAQALYETLQRSHTNLVDLRIPTYENFSLVVALEALDKACHYYLILNKGGRRILMDDDEYDENDTFTSIDQQSTASVPSSRREQRQERHRRRKVPLGLWPLVLERVNRTDLVIPWGRTQLFNCVESNRIQVLYYLLQNGPILREHH